MYCFPESSANWGLSPSFKETDLKRRTDCFLSDPSEKDRAGKSFLGLVKTLATETHMTVVLGVLTEGRTTVKALTNSRGGKG